MPYTGFQREALRGQLDQVIIILNMYDEGTAGTAQDPRQTQPQTLDAARNAAITALTAALAAWEAVE
jgi:hypothetical protein